MTAELQDRLAQAVEIAWLQAIGAVRAYISGADMDGLRHLSFVGSKGQVARLVDIIEQDAGCEAMRSAFPRDKVAFDLKEAEPDEPANKVPTKSGE